jgi:hypothetical protein
MRGFNDDDGGMGGCEFRSPEALESAVGQETDGYKGDVWSLGAMFFTCIHVKYPFGTVQINERRVVKEAILQAQIPGLISVEPARALLEGAHPTANASHTKVEPVLGSPPTPAQQNLTH